MRRIKTYRLFESVENAHALLHAWVTSNLKNKAQRDELSGELESMHDELAPFRESKILYRYQPLKAKFKEPMFVAFESAVSFSSTVQGARSIQDWMDQAYGEPVDWIIYRKDFRRDEILVDLPMFYGANNLGYPSYNRMVENESEVIVMPTEFEIDQEMIVAQK